jgi:hypothetical protein
VFEKSLKKFFDEFLALEKAFEEEKQQKQELKTVLDEIVKEIEQKAPLLVSLKQENTQLRTLNDDLGGQKTLLGIELQKCRVQNDETFRQLRRFQSENAKLVQSVEDLSKQVQNLLFFELEYSFENVKLQLQTSQNALESEKKEKKQEELSKTKIQEMLLKKQTLFEEVSKQKHALEMQKDQFFMEEHTLASENAFLKTQEKRFLEENLSLKMEN